MRKGDKGVKGRGPLGLAALGLTGVLLALTAGFANTASSRETPEAQPSQSSDPAILKLEVPDHTVPFGYPVEVEVTVESAGPDGGEAPGGVAPGGEAPEGEAPRGEVTILVDGEPTGSPVPLEGGSAEAELDGFEPGDNVVTALFTPEAGNARLSESRTVAVDSAAPGPAGILPCADRQVVLTMARRQGNRIMFEGVSRYQNRGRTVKIRTEGRVVAEARVESDGTYWTSLRDPRRKMGGRTVFTASIGSARSWPRRIGQRITVTDRNPAGSSRSGRSIRIGGLASSRGIRQVVLARQVGCSKQMTVRVKVLGSGTTGGFGLSIPRPGRAEPYAIYRILMSNGTIVSPPIVVRPEK